MKKVLAVVVLLAVSSMVQGCAVPALLGVKSYQSGDTRIDFITGVDLGIGMNGVDTVNNSRGITADGGRRENAPKTSQAY
jgi:hypothetical protein